MFHQREIERENIEGSVQIVNVFLSGEPAERMRGGVACCQYTVVKCLAGLAKSGQSLEKQFIHSEHTRKPKLQRRFSVVTDESFVLRSYARRAVL